MYNEMCLGSICILFEDLGFKIRDQDPTVTKEMTYYHCHVASIYEKIFADVNEIWIIEVCYAFKEIHIDRWRHNKERKLYIVEDVVSLDLYNPNSIDQAVKFVKETIAMAKNES